ncbi:DUF3558 domain-containing protein [Hoyosella rhizosphaerae]|uniref:Lipoprotein LprB n=1 Tax=Hoyosella rhizosphaerae TaxID=1755582 RepID=A0A916ULL6_9ACTN|nr:DUF3558 domain-containing protein [Hoyosella rhizosphaerae]MBN4927802.1 DUF3558 domain-containing protein [Hoyosella rhizosphaerae]GGC76977.1 putative lipoprotein LprB [Hoyosella rhizosphaerae]
MDAQPANPGSHGRSCLIGLAVGLFAAVLLVGCSTDGDQPEATEQPDATEVRVPGLFFGECGGVGTDEVTAAVGTGGLSLAERNSVGCRWESSFFGPRASFSWYRGSPIERERAVVELSGRDVFDVTVNSPAGELHGFAGRGSSICEVSIQSESDFFVWSIVFTQPFSDREMCDRVLSLAEMTVNRAQ